MKIINFYLYTLLINVFLIGSVYALPKWVNDPKLECKEENICAVGIGNNYNLAISDAKNNIQKYFETKISSSFRNELINNNDNVKEYSSEFINEETLGVLKGVEVVKTFNNNKIFYVLASLDKTKMINEVKTDIQSIDEKMLVLVNEATVSSIKKLEKMFSQREELNKKYLFLTNTKIPEIVKYEDIIDKKNKNKKNSVNYYVDVDNSDVRVLLNNLITENAGSIVNNSINANIVIKGKITTKKEFLQVSGFEKHSITVEISSIRDGKIINTLTKKETDTGVSYEQVYSKCINRISNYITENFINLIE
ncbi:MAG: LPP20 family lipoprotein [Rickettsiales bacterium]|nr:LPP20 family lipoprotein [Rickettsiales bacterium]